MPQATYKPLNTGPHHFARFWADRRTFGFTLLIMFLDMFGDEKDEEGHIACLKWEPETIEMELRTETGVDVPADNFDRLMTMILLKTTNSFFISPADFTRACVVLAGHHVDQRTLILPDAADIAWGVTEGLLAAPADQKDRNPFRAQITGFIGHVLDSEGILNPPDVLRIATREKDLVSRVNYEFSDDPEMFTAIHGFEKDKTDEINHLVRSRLRGMFLQIQSLTLKNGNASQVVAKMLSVLPGDEDQPL